MDGKQITSDMFVGGEKAKWHPSQGKHTVKGKTERGKFENLYSSSLFKSNPVVQHIKNFTQSVLTEPLFSVRHFNDLELHPHLISCLKFRLKIDTMTKVQEKSIPLLLEKKDVLIKSCTGSGKTLSYAIPIMHSLQGKQPKIKRCDGLFALIIMPTRELAVQVYECFSNLSKAFTWIVPGYLTGGEKLKSEKARIRKGLNILVATPGRLLHHIDCTANFSLTKIEWLVIDEADKLLEQGFEQSVMKILSHCCSQRQTVLLSATLTRGIENLAGMSLTNPVYVDVSASDESSALKDLILPSALKQFVVIVPAKLRLITLSAFVMNKYFKAKFKAIIFMCSQASVDFHHMLLVEVLTKVMKTKKWKFKLFKLHGNMKQEERKQIFNSFQNAEHGILLSTDVAARGLDMNFVDWIIQYSAPASLEIYVHRVGRTARVGRAGSSLIFLLPSESNFALHLQKHNVQLEEIMMDDILNAFSFIKDILPLELPLKMKTKEDYAAALQNNFEKTVYSNDDLHNSAKEGFSSYIKSYASYPRNMCFALPFKALHLGHLAKSFCLRESPRQIQCPTASFQWSFTQKKQHESDNNLRKVIKRKPTVTLSEYDSGLMCFVKKERKLMKKQ